MDRKVFLDELVKRQGSSSGRDFASRLGISESYWSLIRRGERSLSLTVIDRAIQEFPDLAPYFAQDLLPKPADTPLPVAVSQPVGRKSSWKRVWVNVAVALMIALGGFAAVSGTFTDSLDPSYAAAPPAATATRTPRATSTPRPRTGAREAAKEAATATRTPRPTQTPRPTATATREPTSTPTRDTSAPAAGGATTSTPTATSVVGESSAARKPGGTPTSTATATVSAARKPSGGTGRISITRITANCTSDGTMSGTISFSGPVGATITVTLVVTSHQPGSSKWDETGGTDTVTATIGPNGTATVPYSIDVNKVAGANSYRTEVQSVDGVTGASDDVRGTTTKGPSLPCGGPPTKASTLGTSLLAQLWMVATRQTQ